LAIGADSDAAEPSTSFMQYIEGISRTTYNGQVWPLDSVVGAVARFSLAEQQEYDYPEVVCTWVALRSNIACTCIGSTAYESSLDPDAVTENDTSGGKASDFSSALGSVIAAVGLPVVDLRSRLAEVTD